MLWASADLTATNRIVGRVTASQIASASAASFLLRLTWAPYVSLRHQLDHMPECNQLARPMVRRRAGLHADEARLHIAKQRDKLIAPNFSTEHRVSSIVDAVNLRDVLGDIQSNRDNLHADGPSL